jgi:hypothetical protein
MTILAKLVKENLTIHILIDMVEQQLLIVVSCEPLLLQILKIKITLLIVLCH